MGSDSKLILITGANSGIGLQACKILCIEGHSVIATVRSDEKGNATLHEVQRVCPGADISYMLLDAADMTSIKQFVSQLSEKLAGRKLDVLVNNAGMSSGGGKQYQRAANMKNINYCLATNTAGPLIISELLLDHMKQTAEERGESRIVYTASMIANAGQVNCKFYPEDVWLMDDKHVPNSAGLYKLSKVELIMGVLAQCEELGNNSKVRVNMFCPGPVPTTELTKNESACGKCCFNFVCCCCGCLLGKQTLEQGGEHLAAMAVRHQGESMGNFYVKGSLTEPNPEMLDHDNQQIVLQHSRQLMSE